jgi:hypothetical protein
MEQIPAKENREQYSSKIELRFFRHGEKKEEEEKYDHEIGLTEKAKERAMEKSQTKNIKQSVAFGSKRTRAQEQAGFEMAGGQEEITGKESLEELKEKLNKDLKVGSKLGIDKKLDFDADWESPYGQQLDAAEDFLSFLIEKSDRLAQELGDKNSFTYSRGAANVANIIDKYLKIAPIWDKLIQEKQKKYTDTLERFLGSHQGVGESFLAKAIEKTKGKQERSKFVQALDNEGFDYAEGFDIEILNKGTETPKIYIMYKKGEFEFDEIVPKEIIDEIISENDSSGNEKVN